MSNVAGGDSILDVRYSETLARSLISILIKINDMQVLHILKNI